MSGPVYNVVNWVIGAVAEFSGLLFTDLDLWQVPIGYYILGFLVIGLVINYVMR